jgi:alkanesulfonate monooxygenase SsuD/methylene tetrahydromethanopterin reductase-like flavin-dependent oxidoreductase (luciferase family)
MRFSFFSSTSYMGVAPGLAVWPMPPRFCDRDTAAFSIARGMDTCRRAEALGFDWVSVSEHHYSTLTLTPNACVMAGALSQTCKRAKIAVLGPLVPLGNPVRLAEELALLDHLTEGRVIVLFLQGTPNEHRAYEALSTDARSITQEGIEIVLKAWTADEPFAWHGRHFNFPNVGVWPRPRQEPRPFVFGSGNSEDSARFAARHRLGMALSFMALSGVKERIAFYRDEADKAGWRPEADQILYRGLGHLAESDAEAEREVTEGMEAKVAASLKLQADENCASEPDAPIAERRPLFRPVFQGSPHGVRDITRAFHDAGVGTLDIAFHWGATSYEQQLRSMTLFAEHVIPEARAW